ncbi:MAG: lipoyl synthase [Candidatus Ratteibacteria bacterium]|nr:lipoyl synthase [Candidatus Ratteibacteria bacterium]
MQEYIPDRIKKRVSINKKWEQVKKILNGLAINTVCESAVCPNVYECFCKGYATFMILGNRCTRNCRFCGVLPLKEHTPPDNKEPENIAKAVKLLEMTYVVITSPTRDDLSDGGAEHFATTTKCIKELNPLTKIELLIPDFQGNEESLRKVFEAQPDVISHNIETVPSLYPAVRPSSDYKTSLNVLKAIKQHRIITKSGFMLGLGEKEEEVIELLYSIRETGCDYLVIGQYLKPSKKAVDVREYISPEVFKKYEETGKKMGFKNIFAGTFYRSSYLAEKLLL